jgi:hypothetical protein
MCGPRAGSVVVGVDVSMEMKGLVGDQGMNIADNGMEIAIAPTLDRAVVTKASS